MLKSVGIHFIKLYNIGHSLYSQLLYYNMEQQPPLSAVFSCAGDSIKLTVCGSLPSIKALTSSRHSESYARPPSIPPPTALNDHWLFLRDSTANRSPREVIEPSSL
mmetsp:Transcript_4877/g.6264  ORF Transcript_4877/g.6264 Transcript_4877/m.6264 type:complete len:106 (+) Transcript_4877:402-719(+)